MRKLKDGQSVKSFTDDWPFLAEQNAWDLIEKDYNAIEPSTPPILDGARFNKFIEDLRAIRQYKLTRPEVLEYCKLIDDPKNPPNTGCAAQIRLLPNFLPAPGEITKTCRPSIDDSEKSIIQRVTVIL